MLYDPNLIEAIKRRAYGFYYDEENLEYETKGGGRFLICKKHNRVYFGAGFIKVKIKKLFSASARVGYNFVSKIFTPKTHFKSKLWTQKLIISDKNSKSKTKNDSKK